MRRVLHINWIKNEEHKKYLASYIVKHHPQIWVLLKESQQNLDEIKAIFDAEITFDDSHFDIGQLLKALPVLRPYVVISSD